MCYSWIHSSLSCDEDDNYRQFVTPDYTIAIQDSDMNHSRLLLTAVCIITFLPSSIYVISSYINCTILEISSSTWAFWQLCHFLYFSIIYILQKRYSNLSAIPIASKHSVSIPLKEHLDGQRSESHHFRPLRLHDLISPNDPPDVSALIKFFYNTAELDKLATGPLSMTELDSPNWKSVGNKNNTIAIHERVGKDMLFRVITQLEASSASVFDLFADIPKRPLWDQLCELGEVVSQIDHWTRVIYIRTKSIWPTSSRDLLIRCTIRNLGHERYLMVSKSVEHSSRPPHPNYVRMNANCIGQLFLPIAKNKCQIIQMSDTDLNGWIPKSVIAFISTKALPFAFEKIAHSLTTEPHKSTSDIFKMIALESSGISSPIEQISSIAHREEKEKEQTVFSLLMQIDKRLNVLEERLSRPKTSYLSLINNTFQTFTPYILVSFIAFNVALNRLKH